MINLKTYIIFSSVFAIFTEAFFFNFIIDWKLLYLIIFVNYIILLGYKKIKVNIYFIALLLFLFVHGVITYSTIGIPYNYMISQLLGIAIVGMYYYNFVGIYDRQEIIKTYLQISVYVAIAGYLLWFLNFRDPDYRLRSIFKEPAHYVIVVIPACYYYLKNKNYKNFLIIFGTLIISNSSLGYIGCGLIFLLPTLTLKRLGQFIALAPIVTLIFIYMYQELPFFKMRVDDTYNSLSTISTGKFPDDENTNLSSYVMISNMYIAKENIKDHPLGSGIGSHHYMHVKKYGKKLKPPEYIKTLKLHQSNSFDANSLFVRLISELGIFGFLLAVTGIITGAKVFKSDNLFLAQGIFIYLLLKLFRDGHYFPPELFFFIWLFYFSVIIDRKLINQYKS